jgi:DHA1 family multidrug resistance protein-like MFS transporter
LGSFNYGVNLPDLQQTESSDSTRQEGLPREENLSMGDNKLFPLQFPDREQYLVEFDGIQDPTHPQNWEFNKKSVISSFPMLLKISY